MSINGTSNNFTEIMPMNTAFTAKNLNEGTPLGGTTENGKYDTIELSSDANNASIDAQPNPLIHVPLDEVRGKYIDEKYVPAKYEVTIENFFEKLSAITEQPQTEETMKAIMGYASSFDYKMGVNLFGSENDIFAKVKDLANEMIENHESTSENLETKFTVEGAEFSLTELLNLNTAMKNINEFYHAGTFDYQAKAREAVVAVYLEHDDTGFSAEQNEALKYLFSKNVSRWNSLAEDKINELTYNNMHNVVPDLQGYFHGNGYNLTSNEVLVAKINDIFDHATTTEDFKEAVDEYGNLMRPLYEITEKLSLAYSDEYINYVEKETAKNADELLSFWNKTLF